MKIRFLSGALICALIAAAPFSALAVEKADVEAAITAADEARKKAASVGGEWRDTGKMIKGAKKALEEGDLDKAMGLASKAKDQGELGYAQAMDQKDAGFPAYMLDGAKK